MCLVGSVSSLVKKFSVSANFTKKNLLIHFLLVSNPAQTAIIYWLFIQTQRRIDKVKVYLKGI